jgi:hypothetical protein
MDIIGEQPYADPEYYPKALSILKKEVPVLNLRRLVAIYMLNLLVVIIHPKTRPNPLSLMIRAADFLILWTR